MTSPKLSLTTTSAARPPPTRWSSAPCRTATRSLSRRAREEVDAAFDGRLADVLATLGATGKADEVVKVPTIGRLARRARGGRRARQGRRGRARAGPPRVRRRGPRARGHQARGHHAVHCGPSGRGRGHRAGRVRFDRVPLRARRRPARAGRPGEPGRGHREGAPGRRSRRRPRSPRPVTTTRDFINTPPNDLFPASFAERAAALAEAAGLDVEILDEKALRKGGFGGVLGVGMGSTRPPRLVRISLQRAEGHARRSRSSARASRSTPAASRSSRPRTWKR